MPHFIPLARVLLIVALAGLLGACSKESRKTRSLERAAEAYRTGDFEKARIEYQNVLQTFPDDPTANERLALLWYERGASVRSLAYFNKLVFQAPSAQPLRLKRARLFLALGRTAEARREAEAILRTTSNLPEALVLLTETVRERDDFKLAEDALQKFPDKTSAFFHLAQANLQLLRGDVAAVRNTLQRAVAADPKSPEARLAFARFHASQNNAAQALADHKAAAELAPPRSVVRLAYASYLLQSGAAAEGLSYLKEMTQKTPDYLPGWRALAQVALQERKFDEAVGYLQKALQHDNLDVDTLLLLSRVQLARGDTNGGIATLKQIGTAFPGLAVESYPLALAHLQNRDEASALAAVEQTIKAAPDHVDGLMLFAQLSLKAGRPQPAAEAMNLLVRRRPDLTQGYLLLVEAMAGLGKLEPLVQSMVAGLPTSPNKGQLNYVLGIAYLRLAKTAEARAAFEAALKESPQLLAAAMELVNLDLRENKLDAALTRAQALAAQFPRLPAGPILVARIHLARKEWSAAQAAALAAAELSPADPGVYAVAVPAFSASLDDPAAQARIDALVAKHGTQPLVALFAGQILTAKKDYAKTRELYEKHLAANPGSVAVMNNLANLYAEQLNEPARALEIAQKARALDPSNPAVADTLGWMLFRRNDARGALPHLQAAARGLADNPEVQYHLGVASLATGDEAAALAALRAAAAAKADFSGKADAVAKLAELERKPGAAKAK